MEGAKKRKIEQVAEEANSCVCAGWVLAKPTLLQNVVTGEWAMFMTDHIVFGTTGKNSAIVTTENIPGSCALQWATIVEQATSGQIARFLRVVHVAAASQEVTELRN